MKDLGTFCNCPRLDSGASMNGFILTLTGEEYILCHLLILLLVFPGRPLFEGDNDFRRCLKELFPALKVHLYLP